MGDMNKILRRTGARALMALAVVSALLVPTPHAAAQNEVVPFETDPIQSAGTDGPIWVSEVVGNQVWLGGAFSNIRNPAVFEEPDVASQNLAIIDLNSGLVVGQTFAVDGPVWGIEHRDRTVWVGGDFRNVNGQAHRNLVAFDAVTGEIRPEFAGSSDGFVWDLVEADGWLYAGTSRGVHRYDAQTGERDAGFSVGPTNDVRAVDVHGDLIALGHWDGGSSGVWRISTQQREFSMGNTAYDVEFTRDGSTVYVADQDNDFYKYRVSDGRLQWRIGQSAGDSQAVTVTDDGAIVFAGFHEDWKGNEARKSVALSAENGRELDWYVEMDSYWGVFNIVETRRVAIFRPTGQWEPAQAIVAAGDANGSGSIEAADVHTILAHVAGGVPDALNALGADTNEDGTIDLIDALLVARQLQGA